MRSTSATESLTQGQSTAHVGFVLTGVVNTLLGPILPIITRTWHLDDAQAGRLFAAQFLGAILGTLASSRVMNAIGIRRCAMLGLLLMSAGVTATGLTDARFGALAVVCYGVGLGFVVPAINLWVALANPTRSAAALNLVNASWCIGAASGAPLIIYLAEKFGLTKTLAAVGILLALTAIAGFVAASFSPASSPTAVPPTGSIPPLAAVPIAPLPRLQSTAQRYFIFLICTFLFFYVGTENGIGGWAATYAGRLHILAAAKIGFAESIFYGALLVGRVLAPPILRRITAIQLLLGGLLLAAAGALLFTISPSPATVLPGICIAGIGLAPLFPVTVSLYSNELGATATSSASLIFALGNLGGATFPWLVGRVSTSMNGLRAGMLVPLACIAVMLVLANRLSRVTRSE